MDLFDRLGPTTLERDTSLQSHHLVHEIHQQRQREIERRLLLRSLDPSQIRRRSIRNRLGNGLIQVGSMLVADGPRQVAARR
jgi:hypothetical protein